MGARRITIGLALLILLAACGGRQTGQVEQSSPASQTATLQPTPTSSAAGQVSASPTRAPEPSPVPTAQLSTTTPLPTLTPATTAGAIYVARAGKLIAFDLAQEAAHSTNAKAPGPFRVSPDGSLVALVSADPSSSQGALSITSLNGRQSYSVTDGATSGDVVWAADSSAVAYVVEGSGRRLHPTNCSKGSEVWVFELAGREARKVGDGCNPAWSPDGRRIAYVSAAGILKDPQNELLLVNREGEHGWSPLKGTIEDSSFPAPRSTFYQPFWSADGEHVFVFAHFSEFAETSWSTLEMVDSFEGTTRPVGVATNVDGSNLRVSPDHRRIAYASASAKGTVSVFAHTVLAEKRSWEPPWQPGLAVTLRDREGPGVEYAHAAAWSPDGTQLAILYCRLADNPLGACPKGSTGELRLMDPQTGEISEPLLSEVDLDAGIDWQR